MLSKKMAVLVICIILSLFLLIISLSCFLKSSNTKKQNAFTKNGDLNSHISSTNMISSEREAIQLADIVLTKQLKKNRNDFKLVETNFQEKNGVWKVMYIIDDQTVGGGVSISLSSVNGEIISIEYGE